MKQLKKLNLHEFREMTDNEMKFIIGGSGSDSGCGRDRDNCSGTCTSGDLSGTCGIDPDFAAAGCACIIETSSGS